MKHNWLNPATGRTKEGGAFALLWYSIPQMQFSYLFRQTGESKYASVSRSSNRFWASRKSEGPFRNWMTPSGEWTSDTFSLFEDANQFFAYLVKSYIQSDLEDTELFEIYLKQLTFAIDYYA